MNLLHLPSLVSAKYTEHGWAYLRSSTGNDRDTLTRVTTEEPWRWPTRSTTWQVERTKEAHGRGQL